MDYRYESKFICRFNSTVPTRILWFSFEFLGLKISFALKIEMRAYLTRHKMLENLYFKLLLLCYSDLMCEFKGKQEVKILKNYVPFFSQVYLSKCVT